MAAVRQVKAVIDKEETFLKELAGSQKEALMVLSIGLGEVAFNMLKNLGEVVASFGIVMWKVQRRFSGMRGDGSF